MALTNFSHSCILNHFVWDPLMIVSMVKLNLNVKQTAIEGLTLLGSLKTVPIGNQWYPSRSVKPTLEHTKQKVKQQSPLTSIQFWYIIWMLRPTSATQKVWSPQWLWTLD